MFKNVLVICAGNICRSPTGEYLLQQSLAGTGIRVSSASLSAVVGHPLERNALETLQRHGQQPHEHQVRQLTPQILQRSDLVLVTERHHSHALVLLRKALNRGIENPEAIEQLGMPVYSAIPYSELQKSEEGLHIKSRRKGKSTLTPAPLLAIAHPTELAVKSLRSLHFAMLESGDNRLWI